jgi:hypothetical protein
MSHWIKHFSDGKQEIGSDRHIMKKEASWSQGRLDSMIAATLYFAKKYVSLKGDGPFWQKDIFASTYNLPPRRLARQIGKKIHNGEDGWALLRTWKPNIFTIQIDRAQSSNAIRITSADFGSYLVVTVSNVGDIKITVEKKFHV